MSTTAPLKREDNQYATTLSSESTRPGPGQSLAIACKVHCIRKILKTKFSGFFERGHLLHNYIHIAQDLHLAIVLFPIGSRRSAASSASRLFLGMGGGGDITVVAADDDDVPVDRTATKDTHLFCEFGFTFWTLPAVQYVHMCSFKWVSGQK